VEVATAAIVDHSLAPNGDYVADATGFGGAFTKLRVLDFADLNGLNRRLDAFC
jgi:hypothetical protein